MKQNPDLFSCKLRRWNGNTGACSAISPYASAAARRRSAGPAAA